MSEQLQVVITGNASGAVRAFDATAKAAKAAGDAVDQAGSGSVNSWAALEAEAKDVAQEMARSGEAIEKTGDSVKRSGQSARDASIDFDKFGAAAVAIGGYLTIAGNSALDQIQTIEGLKSAYGDAADEYIAFAEELSSRSIFNDDDILKGERYFATLKNNYELTDQQIRQLMVTTADLASAYGTSFEDASSRITAAIRGEGEAAEFLGLTMNQQAIDRDNLTLSMSNQEAAQFRLNALYQQTGVYAGTAERLVNTEVGARAKLTNMIQDNTQALANFIGPYNAILAGAATGAVGIAQFAGGFTALATGIRTATTASIAFAASPVGAMAIGLTAVIGLATKSFMDHRAEVKAAEEQYRSMIEAAEDLRTQISDLRLEDWADADWAKRLNDKMMGELDWQENWLRDTLMKSFGTGDWFDQMVMDLLPPMQMGEVEGAWKLQAEKLIDSMIPDEADRARFSTAFSDILSLRGVLGETHWDAVQNEADRLIKAFDLADGAISADQLNTQLEQLYKTNLQAAQSISLATIVQNQLTAEQQKWADLGAGSIGEMTTEMTEYETATRGSAAAVRELALAERERKNNRGEYAKGLKEAQDAWWDDFRSRKDAEDEETRQRVEARRQERRERLEGASEYLNALALQEAQSGRVAGAEILNNRGVVASINEIKAAYQEMTSAREEELTGLLGSVMGLDDPLTKWNATGFGDDLTKAAQAARDAQTSMESVWRVVVENTNGFASLSQGAEDWAEELINVQGEAGKIDDLLAKGLITQTEYTQAQTAYNDIVRENAEIQDHVLAIQAQQSPIIRDQLAMLENTLQTISEMEGGEQLAALGWLDAASAAKALEINTLGVAAATGELGANGRDAFQSYIDGITATDPVMTQMLLQMGLIEEHIDSSGNKTYSINWEGFEEGESNIDRLIESIDALTRALGGVPPLRLEVQGRDAVDGAIAAIKSLDGTTTHTVDIEVKTPGDAGSFLSGRIQDLMGLGDDPIEVPAIPVWMGPTEGYGGATSLVSEPLTVPVVGQLQGLVGGEMGGLAGLKDGFANDITITVTQVGMESVIGLAQATQNAIAGIPSSHDTAITESGAASVIGNAHATANAIDAIPDSHSTSITLNGAAAAIGNAHAVANAINAIPTSRTSTISVVTQYSSVGTPGRAELHGGIAGYALGGVVPANLIPVWTSEPGTEIAHFAGGGSVALPGEGLRYVPPGTYIEPHNSAMARGGGRPIQIIVQGSVLTERELIGKAAEAIWAVEAAEEIRERLEAGVA